MASRIFVKNLPPNLKEEDFKKHFSGLALVTDTKFFPRRRIGYIGYKTPEIALKAIKYYNKSFIRMSKINVELARSSDEVQPRKKPKFDNDQQIHDMDSQGHQFDDAPNPKLQEFLSTMKPSSKGKTWGNEDSLTSGQPLPQTVIVEQGKIDSSDEDYRSISKKRKRQDNHGTHSEGSDGINMLTQAEHNNPKVVDDAKTRTVIPIEDSMQVDERMVSEKQVDLPPTTTSDSEWMRSKTSRLLGLVDDDEFARETQRPLNGQQDKAELSESEAENGRQQLVVYDKKDHTDDSGHDEITEQIDASQKMLGTARLFLRNLSYQTSETELEKHFANYGSIEEVHVSKDIRTGMSKGFGYIQFRSAEEATAATEALDGKSFQGRLLHIIPAKSKKLGGLDEYEISKLPLKKQREIRRKAEASTATFKWNSMYMNPDAILSSVAARLGISKTDILDPTSSDAAVKQAHAETDVIKENKTYFTKHGVNLDSFKGKEYNDRAILIKNFPYGTKAEELKKMFEVHGTISRLLMPPSATVAIIEMEKPTQAKSAFGALAYRKFKDSVLFLEKAPGALFISETPSSIEESELQRVTPSDLLTNEEAALPQLPTTTLFVRNLNFSTISSDLRNLFGPLNGFLSATVRTKTDPKKPGQILSMGFGFVEFRSKQDASSAMAAINGQKLAGHELIIKESTKVMDAAEERRREDAAKKLAAQRTKIIIRNLPFEATKKDVRALFGPYGQLRTVRVPKKFDNTSRGFAFAEFLTTREAENAIKSLTGVHLLGRRLNLEYAAGDTIDAEEEIEKMSKKISRQADRVAVQNLTGGGRKKFSVRQGEDDID